jgi:hypothetical protein
MAERARANRKIHFTTHVHPVAFRAHTEPWTVTIQLSRCCAPSYVSHFQRPYFYVVQFIAPALLCALARNAIATADQSEASFCRPHRSGTGYPEKQFRKTPPR